jgi:predicted MFS family arabinose efflux permease
VLPSTRTKAGSTVASAPDVISEPARRSVLQVVIHSPRPVWILVIGVFLNRAGAYFATFLALFLKQFGFTATQIPAILLVVGLVTPLGSLLGGWASDRFSRKLSLVGTTLLAAVGLAIVGFAGSTTVALVGVAVAALFTQSYLPAASALLVDNAAEADRVPTFAFFRLMLNLGAAIGPALAIVIVSHGLHLLFLVSCGCSLVFSLVLLVGLPNSRKRATAAADASAA